MSTPAQITANRLNAQRSTGPRTEEGKSASRMNSLQHGLTSTKVYPVANQADFDDLVAAYAAHYQPASVEELQRVDTMVHADWNLKRYRQLHEDALEVLRQEDPAKSEAQVVIADLRGPKVIDRLNRYQRDLMRAWERALAALAKSRERQEKQAARELESQIDREFQQVETKVHQAFTAVLAERAERAAQRPVPAPAPTPGPELVPNPSPEAAPQAAPDPGIGFVSSPAPQPPAAAAKPAKSYGPRENLALRL